MDLAGRPARSEILQSIQEKQVYGLLFWVMSYERDSFSLVINKV